MPPFQEAFPISPERNICQEKRLNFATTTVLSLIFNLFPGLVHDFFMSRNTFAHFLKAQTELLAVTSLVFELLAESLTELVTLFTAAFCQVFLLIPELLLVLFAGPGHILNSVLYLFGQAFFQLVAVVFKTWIADLQAVAELGFGLKFVRSAILGDGKAYACQNYSHDQQF